MVSLPQLDRLSSTKTAWLLLAQAAVIAPHFLHTPLWLGGLCLALGVWRYRISVTGAALPGRVIRIALLLVVVAAVLLQYRTLTGRDAGVALLIGMLSLKLLEMRSRRDIMLFLSMGFFLVITNFLYSQSMAMAVYMFVVTFVLIITLILVNHPADTLSPKRHVKLTGLLLLQALPLMLILFVLFPRLDSPLWRLPQDAHSAVSGLSDQMSPGSISQLSQSNAVAFRASFIGTPPDNAALYWRGLVMWHYDGRTWYSDEERPQLIPKPVDETLNPVTYEVTLEPHQRTWLFALDLPLRAPARAYLTEGFMLRHEDKLEERYVYRMQSYTQARDDFALSDRQRRIALQIPAESNPRAQALALRLRHGSNSANDYVRTVLDYFRQQNFVYTLSPPLLGEDPMDAFLFESRLGFCEHYASAFVFLMRAAGVPARVVTGYQGGELNPLGNYMIVRQSDAHAWAEVWLEGIGWQRIDPTAVVAPARVQAGIEAALPDALPITTLARSDWGLLRSMARAWDAMQHKWNQYVLGYGSQTQRNLMARLGLSGGMLQLAITLAIAVALLLLLLAAWLHRRRQRAIADPVQAVYLRFLKKMRRAGCERLAHEGPLDFARRCRRQWPQLAAQIDAITHLYIDQRYADKASGRGLRQLRERVNRLAIRTPAN